MKFEVEVSRETYRSFHSNVEILKSSIEHFMHISDHKYAELVQKHGLTVANMVNELFSIEGVNDIFVSPYSVSVSMVEHCFKWNKGIDAVVERAFQITANRKTPPKIQGTILTETYPNTRVKTYHVSFQISNTVIETFRRPIRPSSDQYLNKVEYPGKILVRRLLKIDGVTEVTIRPYSVGITVAKLFRWDDVESDIYQIFDEMFGPYLEFRNK